LNVDACKKVLTELKFLSDGSLVIRMRMSLLYVWVFAPGENSVGKLLEYCWNNIRIWLEIYWKAIRVRRSLISFSHRSKMVSSRT
jgi:hypothetical protein